MRDFVVSPKGDFVHRQEIVIKSHDGGIYFESLFINLAKPLWPKVVSEPVSLHKGEVSTIGKETVSLPSDLPYADPAREPNVETMLVDDVQERKPTTAELALVGGGEAAVAAPSSSNPETQ
jgi:hypothetical protein